MCCFSVSRASPFRRRTERGCRLVGGGTAHLLAFTSPPSTPWIRKRKKRRRHEGEMSWNIGEKVGTSSGKGGRIWQATSGIRRAWVGTQTVVKSSMPLGKKIWTTRGCRSSPVIYGVKMYPSKQKKTSSVTLTGSFMLAGQLSPCNNLPQKNL